MNQSVGPSSPKLLILLLLLLFAATSSLAVNQDLSALLTTAQPNITESNGNYHDSTGRLVIFHGMNIMNKAGQNIPNPPAIDPERGYQYLSNFYVTTPGSIYTLGEQWARFYVQNGFNLARVGIFWNSVEPSPGVYDDNYIHKISDMVHMFGKYKIYTVLDFHQDSWDNGDVNDVNGQGYVGLPLWAFNNNLDGVAQTCPMPYQDPSLSYICTSPQRAFQNYDMRLVAAWDNFWKNNPAIGDTVGLQDRYLRMYAHAIPFFRTEPYLLSYSELNEKEADFATFSCLGYFENPSATPPATMLRDSCPQFFIGPYAAFKNKFDALIYHLDPKRMSQHDLTRYELLGQYAVISAPLVPNSIVGLSSYFATNQPHQDLIIYDKSEAKQNNSAWISTEFGAGLDTVNNLGAAINFFDSQNISWSFWNFASTELGRDTSQNVYLNTALPPTTNNVDLPTLAEIVRPYPRVIAGSNPIYSYVPNNNIAGQPNINNFTLSYYARPSNQQGNDDAKEDSSISDVTEIYVPHSKYPNGYRVNMTGGKVVSARNADILLIRSNGGLVNLTVTGASAPFVTYQYFVSVFDLGANFIFGATIRQQDMPVTISNTGVVSMQPFSYFYDPSKPFWATPGTPPTPNKIAQTVIYYESDANQEGLLNDKTITFSGKILNNTLGVEPLTGVQYNVQAFINVFDVNFNVIGFSYLPIDPNQATILNHGLDVGSFSLTLDTKIPGAFAVQYGFQIYGPVVSASEAAKLGTVTAIMNPIVISP